MFISKTNSKPLSYTDSDWGSSVVGEDIVSISSKNISKGDVFYVGVKCFKKCSFNLSAHFSEEMQVKSNVYYTLNLVKGDTKVLRYSVPNDTEITSISFIARMNTSDHTIWMFVNADGDGKMPTSSHPEGQPSWKDGLVFHLSNSSSHMIPSGKEVLLLLTTNSSISIDFTPWVSWNVVRLEPGKDYEDYVEFWELECFSYIVWDDFTKLVVSVKSYSGNPDIYVNPKTLPATKELFVFNSVGNFDDKLIVSKEERKEAKFPTGEYFICIYGNHTSSYTIRVNEFDNDLLIQDSVTETLSLEASEKVNFVYSDESLNRDLEISI